MKKRTLGRWLALSVALVMAAGSACCTGMAADLLTDGGYTEEAPEADLGFAGAVFEEDILGSTADTEVPAAEFTVPAEAESQEAAPAAQEAFEDAAPEGEMLDSGEPEDADENGASELLLEEEEPEEADEEILIGAEEEPVEAAEETEEPELLEEDAPEAAEASPAEDFTYVQSGDAISITGYKGTAEAVVVPAEIDGHPVTTIAGGAFNADNTKTVKSITLSEGISTVEAGSFAGCEALEELSFPASLIVTSEECTREDGKTVFPVECPAVASLKVAAGNTTLREINGAVYSADKKMLYYYPTGSKETSFTSVAGVEYICNCAFSGNTVIEEVVLPDTVEVIGYRAFAFCTALKAMKGGYKDDEHVHEMTTVAEIPAKCETDGQIAHFKCEGCGLLYRDAEGKEALTEADLVIPALGHKWDEGTVTKEPTCTETGVRTYTCQNDTSHTKPEDIPALGHDYQEQIVKATFEKDGKISKICSRCKDETDIQVIPHPATVKLSETETAWDGNEHKPELIIQDAEGNAFPEEMYSVTWPASMKDAGVYAITVTLKGNAEGSKDLTYTINGSSELSFTDVQDAKKFYYEPVYWAAGLGITTGTKTASGELTGKFEPNNNCTREEIVTFLWRMAGKPTPTKQANFIDMKAGAYYCDPISWALENGITTGVSDEKFGVKQPCTRGMCVTFLYRMAGKPDVTGEESAFTDVPAGKYYEKPVAWAVCKGITTGFKDGNGNPTGKFAPEQYCTRGEIVTFLYRYTHAQ